LHWAASVIDACVLMDRTYHSGRKHLAAWVARMNAARIAHALHGGYKSGRSWVACCPAHEDRTPSLSLRDSTNGRVLVHCHAGYAQTAVIGELKNLGLWPESEKRAERRRIIAEYNYTDEHGEVLYQVVRTDPKGFFQRYPDGRSGWINRKYRRQVLYRLPDVVEAAIVFLVEGEQDVETLRAHGFVATTIAGGANAEWLPTFTEVLLGREVILIPDNDEPGWALMRRIARALLGKVARLICFDDHHHAGVKDITEWFELGRAEIEFMNLLESGWRTK
jgi:putative DNA primase/helicase